jgi:hypothetical protein
MVRPRRGRANYSVQAILAACGEPSPPARCLHIARSPARLAGLFPPARAYQISLERGIALVGTAPPARVDPAQAALCEIDTVIPARAGPTGPSGVVSNSSAAHPRTRGAYAPLSTVSPPTCILPCIPV